MSIFSGFNEFKLFIKEINDDENDDYAEYDEIDKSWSKLLRANKNQSSLYTSLLGFLLFALFYLMLNIIFSSL